MGRKGNISKKEREGYRKLAVQRDVDFKAKTEILRTKFKELIPEGDYRNDVVLHPLLVMIVCNFYGFKYEQGLFWYRGEMQTHTYALDHLNHFISYYLLDDGDITHNEETDEIHFTCNHDIFFKEEAIEWLLKKISEPVTSDK